VLPDGRTSFQAMQRGRSGDRPTLAYFVFDLIHLDGQDIGALPLEARKEHLRALLGDRPPHPFRYVDHVVGQGQRVFAEASRMGLEGIVSKKRSAPYRAGARNLTWQKIKCVLRQELVVGGYEESVLGGLGALLLGHYDADGDLVYAGKVGTGFQRIERELFASCKALETPAPPFTVNLPQGAAIRDTHWMKPAMVVEVAFAEWTDGGHIRHPSFQGVRKDKPARAVRREIPAAAPAATPPKRKRR
jgi:bifunctional non-homologous end joining protein LigD